jgi:hypothetical protein
MKATRTALERHRSSWLRCIRSLPIGVCLLSVSVVTCPADFQNLDFEEGPAYYTPDYSIYPDVLPYWTIRFGSDIQPGANCNDFILDVPAVALMTADSVLGPPFVISGQRSVFLQATDYYQVGGLDFLVSISQIGIVPLDAQSLVFDALNPWYGPWGEGWPVGPGPLYATLNGVALPLFELASDGGANVTYGADISGWAGQSAELSIGVLPSSPVFAGHGWSSVDSIRFSPEVVPEPTTILLVGFGLLGLFWRHWRREH